MKKKTKVIDILLVILVGVMLFSGYKLIKIKQESDSTESQFENLEQIIQNEETTDESYSTAKEKYQSVYDINNHLIGWIFLPDTALNYPVMQTKDSPEYYLRRDFEGKYSSYGVPFMDYRCTADESDNIIIYGHNMTNGTMFSAVTQYTDKRYWENHRYIGFDTMNSFGTYEVAIHALIDLQTTNFNYIADVDFANKDHFDSYIAQAKQYQLYDTGVSLEYGDKLLLLSTCQTGYDDGRHIIIAKKISDNDLSRVAPAE